MGIITRGFKIETGLVFISMLIGAVWKIKREDNKRYKDALKFLIVIGIILIILQIMVFISLR
ncbi:hypothetical protein DesyoDRAFT_3066 [Desulfosporosinus youngiae DSM 17734]|uniref:Uncharacterized protein n=1 Tax=Desulfosporosinus youngiae DSM 17734 TaxID=768710 RepID=H5XVM6_9FIRM|nr:hypothetical protein DesyoDRAFT_3066 [Desulfosporosinus youngiae DSM 17734]